MLNDKYTSISLHVLCVLPSPSMCPIDDFITSVPFGIFPLEEKEHIHTLNVCLDEWSSFFLVSREIEFCYLKLARQSVHYQQNEKTVFLLPLRFISHARSQRLPQMNEYFKEMHLFMNIQYSTFSVFRPSP